MGIGERICQLRQKLEMSQGQLARACGISQGYLSQLESGQSDNVTLKLGLRLCKALNINLHQLAGEREMTNDQWVHPLLRNSLKNLTVDQQLKLTSFLEGMPLGRTG